MKLYNFILFQKCPELNKFVKPVFVIVRRNLDVAVQEWARLHKDAVGGTKEDQEALARAGKIMMSIGHQLEDTTIEEGEDQNGLERRVKAVWKHRQAKLDAAKEKRKSGIWNLLSCGGGKSKQVEEAATGGNRPLEPMPQVNTP